MAVESKYFNFFYLLMPINGNALSAASFQGKRDFQCFNPADPYSGVHCQDVYEQIYLRGIDSPCNEKWFGLSCCNFCTNKGKMN